MTKRIIPYLESRQEEVSNWITSGCTIKQVSEFLNVSGNYVSLFCRNNNLTYNLERYSPEEDDILRNNLTLTNEEIAILLPKRNAESVGGRLETLGLNKIVSKQWDVTEIDTLKTNFPNISMDNLKILLPGYNKSEINYMAKKLGLNKTDERSKERRAENSKLSPGYAAKIKIENTLRELIEKHSGNLHKAVKEFKLCFNPTNYPKKRIYEFLVSDGFINPEKYYLYLDIYYPLGINLNFQQSLEAYDEILKEELDAIIFSKENTKKLFVYWANKNDFNIAKDSLLKAKEFRSISLRSKLDWSIRANYKYTYQFFADLLDMPDLKPYHIGIQVPDKYWDNDSNLFGMIAESVSNMILEEVISSPEEMICLDREILIDYFFGYTIHRNKKNILDRYLISRGIQFDRKKLKYFDGYYFDSIEEMSIYKKLKNLGYDIIKCSRKDKYYNPEESGSYYLPDFKINISGKQYIVEYFGLYTNRYTHSMIAPYKERADKKIKYFSSNFDFIPLFPEDYKHKMKGIIDKLEERR